MLSNLQAPTTKSISKMLCYYTNSTRKMQIIRVTNSGKSDLEKIVFPRQRILFEAIPEAQLEIYTSLAGEQKIAQIIPCQKLQVEEVWQKPTFVETIGLQKNKSAGNVFV